MTVARNYLVQEEVERVYHCVSLCRKGTYLRGKDKASERFFDHRMVWIQERLMELAGSFAMEICAYSVGLKELHLVLRTRPDWIKEWTDIEVARRWLSCFPKKSGKKRLPELPDADSANRLASEKKRIRELRLRLSSVSWFMRSLNEYVGRRANKEESFRGRFWKGRFKCQVLLDESAYLACMAYVDLIPVLVGMKREFEECAYSSVYQRSSTGRTIESPDQSGQPTGDMWLCPIGNEEGRRGLLPITSNQYLEVLDWTKQHIKKRKKPTLPENIGLVLVHLNIDHHHWLETVKGYGRHFYRVAGRADSIKAEAQRVGHQWLCGYRPAEKLFKKPEA